LGLLDPANQQQQQGLEVVRLLTHSRPYQLSLQCTSWHLQQLLQKKRGQWQRQCKFHHGHALACHLLLAS
jgi:hypothetical protein